MEKDQLPRKLAVILHADVVGSTELVRRNEVLAHRRIRDAFLELSQTLAAHNGIQREIRGDALVAEFDRASDAVTAAIAFQTAHEKSAANNDDDIRPGIRIGIGLGEVVVADETITGAGVIVAQRLEQLAESGGIVVQGAVAEAVPDRFAFEFRNLGEQDLKGFDKPVRAFAVDRKPGEPKQSNTRDLQSANEADPANHDIRIAIAVLPFANMSKDPEGEFFGDGIAEEIITQLSRLSSLIVIARTSSFAYKDRAVDIRQIGRELDVSHVLEGSIRIAGNRIRVIGQLIEASSGRHVWADRYDRELVDIFELQDEIMREIVSALDIRIFSGEQSRLWSEGTGNLQAWECFRQARDLFNRYRSEDHPEIIRLLKKALDSDDEYGAAWHLLAGCYFHIEDDIRYSDADRDEARLLSRQYLEKAIEFAPSYPDAWSLRAMHHLTDRHFEQAIADTEKATEMAPNHANLLASSGIVLTKCGLPEIGLQRIRRAMQLCPIFPVWFYSHCGQACRILGKTDEAISEYLEMLQKDPDQREGHIGLAGIYSESGEMEKARKHAAEILRIDPAFSVNRYFGNISFRDSSIVDRFAAALRDIGLPD